jgi:hypothetical protein
MKIPMQWDDHPGLLEFVGHALEVALEDGLADIYVAIAGIRVSDECGSYGEEGIVEITLADGRRFRLDLNEIV